MSEPNVSARFDTDPDAEEPTVRSEATVTVKQAVDGTVKKRTRGKSKGNGAKDTHSVTVDPRVMEQAKAECKPTQRLIIVGPCEVWIVNKGSKLKPTAAQLAAARS